SKRVIDLDTAAAINAAVGERARLVAVVANLAGEEASRLRLETGIRWLQLHGDEPAAALDTLLPEAYKAVAIAGAEDVERADRYGGELLLCDTKVDGAFGGSGKTFDWRLVLALAERRKLVLAGGLTSENVSQAVRTVRPFGVDVASGVEADSPRRKDAAKMALFVERARAGGIE
ncbi:MAG TPA: phosphoribosylanthranilate isomerase, partial [Polyangiaceae bacterium]|nr:phosphoribosylanthranilate isomerase [Polyangiaceae bacterium]